MVVVVVAGSSCVSQQQQQGSKIQHNFNFKNQGSTGKYSSKSYLVLKVNFGFSHFAEIIYAKSKISEII